jgi:hypothetical protein
VGVTSSDFGIAVGAEVSVGSGVFVSVNKGRVVAVRDGDTVIEAPGGEVVAASPQAVSIKVMTRGMSVFVKVFIVKRGDSKLFFPTPDEKPTNQDYEAQYG